MVVGNGQLATIFKSHDLENTIFFASGVSDSNCTDEHEFNRESELLNVYLKKHSDLKFVYFSSSALSAEKYKKNKYYIHKKNMEDMIQHSSNNYYIFRVPQLFGKLINHKTLINYLYEKISNKKEFIIYSGAFRYVIFIDDLHKIISSYLKYEKSNVILDIANPYKYSIHEIIVIIERLTNTKAFYQSIEKSDQYDLDLTQMMIFLKQRNISITFGKEYLSNKLEQIINN